MTIWQDCVTAHFPQARCLTDARRWMQRQLEVEYGGEPRTTLLGTSACCDDILASKDLGRDFWGPFTLGGLCGYPFGGRTGMKAFAHHVPDGGTALLVYGTHIGVTQAGTLGKMLRPGQRHETTSCGALMAVLQHLAGVDGAGDASADGDDDREQAFWQRTLWPYRARICAAPSPEQAITEIAYAVIHRQVHQLLESTRSQFCGARIVYFGCICINTDPEAEDWLDIRDYGVIKT